MSRFIPIKEVLELAMLSQDDYLQRRKGKLLAYSKYVWEDMNMNTVKIARRELFKINKRTNTIDLPCDFSQLSSVNVIDHRGTIHPVFRNDRLHDDIVDIGAKKDCACELQCGYQICNMIKGYEAIQSVKSDFMPNGNPVSFNCVDRISSDKNGFVYKQTQYPLRVYISGVWTNTIMQTDNIKLCQCEVDNNGCICDTDANIDLICSHCGGAPSIGGIPIGGNAMTPPGFGNSTWIYQCNSKFDWFSIQCGSWSYMNRGCNNIYNISELQDRLIFPPDFGWESALVRYYATPSLNNLLIPFMAVGAFITGLKWFDARWNDKKQNLAQKYAHDYGMQKFSLLLELNKYRISELRQILTPPVYMPSYLPLYPNQRGWGETPLW